MGRILTGTTTELPVEVELFAREHDDCVLHHKSPGRRSYTPLPVTVPSPTALLERVRALLADDVTRPAFFALGRSPGDDKLRWRVGEALVDDDPGDAGTGSTLAVGQLTRLLVTTLQQYSRSVAQHAATVTDVLTETHESQRDFLAQLGELARDSSDSQVELAKLGMIGDTLNTVAPIVLGKLAGGPLPSSSSASDPVPPSAHSCDLAAAIAKEADSVERLKGRVRAQIGEFWLEVPEELRDKWSACSTVASIKSLASEAWTQHQSGGISLSAAAAAAIVPALAQIAAL
jgi:hypothetical protein